LNCRGNDLPYNNLKEYWVWYYKENPKEKAADEFNI